MSYRFTSLWLLANLARECRFNLLRLETREFYGFYIAIPRGTHFGGHLFGGTPHDFERELVDNLRSNRGLTQYPVDFLVKPGDDVPGHAFRSRKPDPDRSGGVSRHRFGQGRNLGNERKAAVTRKAYGLEFAGLEMGTHGAVGDARKLYFVRKQC